MDKSKLEMLQHIATLHIQGYPWVRVTRDGTRIKDEERAWSIQADDAHPLRLSWFGLLERLAPRAGKYRVTALGYGFLAGRATVPDTIWCLRGKVYKSTPAQVTVDHVKDVILDKTYWDNYARVQGYV